MIKTGNHRIGKRLEERTMNQRDMALLIEVEDEPDKMDQALKQLASYMGSDEAGLDHCLNWKEQTR